MTNIQALIQRESYRLRWLRALAGRDAGKFAALSTCPLFAVALDGKGAMEAEYAKACRRRAA